MHNHVRYAFAKKGIDKLSYSTNNFFFPGSPVSKKAKQDVIDLTLSSSDEEDEGRATPKNVISAGCVSPAVISLDSPTPTHSLISSHDSPLHASLLSSSSCSSSSSTHRNSPGFANTPTHASNHSLSPVHSPRSTTGSIPPHSPYGSPNPSPLSPHPSPLHYKCPSIASTSAFNPVLPFLPAPASSTMANPIPSSSNAIYPSAAGYSPLPMFPNLENEDKDLDEIIKNIIWDYNHDNR